ncbi:hypothetical protein BGZ82_005357 [Podila clonocystis]|nr:hypothetical protein BGZ82_005357 [Podila clonocystis]
MIFARTLVVLCLAAVTMAMDGLRCKCKGSSMTDGKLPPMNTKYEIWTKNTCSNLHKEIKWCYGAAQDFCETGNMGNAFRSRCSQRGGDCFAVDC